MGFLNYDQKKMLDVKSKGAEGELEEGGTRHYCFGKADMQTVQVYICRTVPLLIGIWLYHVC